MQTIADKMYRGKNWYFSKISPPIKIPNFKEMPATICKLPYFLPVFF